MIAGGALVIGLALVARSQKIDEKLNHTQEFTESEGTNLEEEIDDSAQENDAHFFDFEDDFDQLEIIF